METSIATLLKKFGSKIGLGETLDLGEEGNIRLTRIFHISAKN